LIHRDFDLLAPSFVDAAKASYSAMQADTEIRAAGYQVIVLETRRDLCVQMAYASRGRMPPEWVRRYFAAAGLWTPTDAECGRASTWTLQSKHLEGLAFDAAPSRDGKSADWTAPAEVWERMAMIAEEHGLAAGRRWKNQDSPHFEKA
jgi:hypothetical protein